MTYHAITVTFENIGGIAIQKDKGAARTAFNVTVGGKRQYSVQVRGEPRLENGMVVTAVLRDTDNWQTLAGWLNHATGEICGVDPPGKCFWSFMVVFLVSALFSVKWLNEAASGKANVVGIIVWILGVISMNVWSLSFWRKSVAVYSLLKP
jgi:hypothetical protein